MVGQTRLPNSTSRLTLSRNLLWPAFSKSQSSSSLNRLQVECLITLPKASRPKRTIPTLLTSQQITTDKLTTTPTCRATLLTVLSTSSHPKTNLRSQSQISMRRTLSRVATSQISSETHPIFSTRKLISYIKVPTKVSQMVSNFRRRAHHHLSASSITVITR